MLETTSYHSNVNEKIASKNNIQKTILFYKRMGNPRFKVAISS